MLWVKRNLLFVIACVIGVLLIGVAIFIYFQKRSEEADVSLMLEERTTRLKELYELPVFPSAENLRGIEEDQRKLVGFIEQCKKYFAPVPPIDVPNAQSLRTALDTNIYKFHQEAKNSGVTIAINNYAFSFDELIKRIDYTPFSIRPLAQQLSEIDKMLEILYAAKINRLELIQRARVCIEDMQPNISATHYIAEPPITNSVMSVRPYRLIFSCFSSELANVLEGFMRSPYGFVIKAIDVEPTVPGAAPGIPGITPPGQQPPPGFTPMPQPGFVPQPGQPGFPRGIPGFPRGGRQPGGNLPRRGFNPNQPPSYAAPAPAAYGATMARTNKPGVITLFNERPFRVSMLIYVVNFR
jgi:hypothetical protein